MRPTQVFEFANWVDGWADGFESGAAITTFCLDSNSVQPGDLFLAIKGERVDGHDFVELALALGAIGSFAERPVAPPSIQVPNLVDALAKLGSHYRNQFSGPVLAITGSAGKTTTKEFVASALSPLGPVLKTHGNRNTEYTVPLLWTELQQNHRVAVIEMSMRGFGQIRHLASFSRPTMALITNIGYAHMLQVGSREGIANAKGELLEQLPNGGTALLWQEDDYLAHLKAKTTHGIKTFGISEGADCRVTGYQALGWSSSAVEGECNGVKWQAELPAVGRHIALNAAAAVLAASELGVEPREAAAQLKNTVLPPLRMQVIEHQGATILLDTYNASPPSMIAAIETLAELPMSGSRYAVIGDMKELGDYSDEAHRNVGECIGSSGIAKVLFFGEATKLSAKSALESGMRPTDILQTDDIEDVRTFLSALHPGDAALVKGSRSLELERAVGPVETH